MSDVLLLTLEDCGCTGQLQVRMPEAGFNCIDKRGLNINIKVTLKIKMTYVPTYTHTNRTAACQPSSSNACVVGKKECACNMCAYVYIYLCIMCF